MGRYMLFLDNKDGRIYSSDESKIYFPQDGYDIKVGVVKVESTVDKRTCEFVKGVNVKSSEESDFPSGILEELSKKGNHRFLSARNMFLVGGCLIILLEDMGLYFVKGGDLIRLCGEASLSKTYSKNFINFKNLILKYKIPTEKIGVSAYIHELFNDLVDLPEYGVYFESLVRHIPNLLSVYCENKNSIEVLGSKLINLKSSRDGKVICNHLLYWDPEGKELREVSPYWNDVLFKLYGKTSRDITDKVIEDVLDMGIVLQVPPYFEKEGVKVKSFSYGDSSVYVEFFVSGLFTYELYEERKDEVQSSIAKLKELKKAVGQSLTAETAGTLKSLNIRSYQLNDYFR